MHPSLTLALRLAQDLFNLGCLVSLFHIGRLYERERWTEAHEQQTTDHEER